MKSSSRIALNTFVSYGRTLFAMALGLFSSRWILQSLGDVDFGLMGVVGALIVFITFLNAVTANSCARFYAYSIGQGDIEATNKWFNTALSIHTILPAGLIIIGWFLGVWAIKNFINIPPERLSTAMWVFRLSLISAFANMCFTPYIGMFTAKQRIYEMSIWGMLQTMLAFCLAFSLTRYHGDAWLFYSAGTVLIMIFIGVCQTIRARVIFQECRINFRFWWNWEFIKQVTSFSGWSIFGGIGVILRGQGIAILLNKYFSPSVFPFVNASYAVGNNLSGYTQTLSAALLGAFAPEITSTEGRGDRNRMLALANKASKFGTLLVLLFAIPLMLEIDYILDLWLKNPPEMAGKFCCLILVQFLIDKITYGQMAAVSARGKIAGYQLMIGMCLILTLPLAWFFLHYGASPISVMTAIIITSVMQSAGRVILAKYLVKASPMLWLREVFLPCLCVFSISYALGYVCQGAFNSRSLLRLFSVSLCTLIITLVLGWFLVMKHEERQSVRRMIIRFVKATSAKVFK